MLSVHLAMMDRKALEDGALSLHAIRQYLAWSNALTRAVRELAVNGAEDIGAGPSYHLPSSYTLLDKTAWE